VSVGSLVTHWYRPDGRIRGCYVYMLFCGDGTGDLFVKVGMTANPEQRLEALRTAVPIPTEMFAVVEVPSRKLALRLERALHEAFEQWASRGEWFRLTLDDKPTFKAAWQEVFRLHQRPSWELKWTYMNMERYEAARAQRRNYWRFKFSRFGAAYRDYLRDSKRAGI